MIVPRWVYPSKADYTAQESIFLDRLYDYPARHWPGKCAIRDGKKQYTFAALQEKTRALSAMLIRKGLKKGDRVLVVAEKCAEMAIIGAAIWKAGAVYVPVDPANPPGRNEYLLRSIEPSLIISPRTFDTRTRFGGLTIPVITFDEAVNVPVSLAEEETVFPEIADGDLAYIMHTSGSTGHPKGVMIEHGSVADYFYNHNRVLRFTDQSYCLSNAPFYFDVSVEDTFLPLSVGAAVYQYRGMHISALFLNLLSSEKITHLIAVSTVLTLITGDGQQLRKADLANLEMVMTGAEVCDVKILNLWKELLPHVRLINVYGPTETTIVCTAYTINGSDHGRNEFYPIGRQLENVVAVLMDDDNTPITTAGKRGMLWIGGRQVMRGYWKDPSLSRKVLAQYKGQPFYKTGDVCYYDDLGELVFCGRNDEEIKLNGRRINLAEIKRVMLQVEGVRVVSAGLINVNTKAALAAVAYSDSIRDTNELSAVRDIMIGQLPLYMVPEYFGLINDPLLLPTGKSDDKRAIELLQKEVDRVQRPFMKIVG